MIHHCPTCDCDTIPLDSGKCAWCSTAIVPRRCACGAMTARPSETRCHACIHADRKAGISRRRGRPRRVEA